MKRTWRKLEPVSRMFETPDKTNSFFIATSTVAMDQEDPDHPALFLVNFLLGGDQSNNRLWNRIREKEGLSYSVGSNVGIGA